MEAAERADLRVLRREIGRRWGGISASMGPPRPASQEVLSTGSAVVDELLPGGGVPRGRLSEVSGGRSSGKTSLVAGLVAQTLRAGYRVAWVDPLRQFDPASAERAGISLQELLWIQPGPRGGGEAGDSAGAGPAWRRQEVMRVAEPLVRSGAFALVVLDAIHLSGGGLLSPLFRLSRQVAKRGTVVVFVTERPGQKPSLGSCIALRLCIERRSYCFEPGPRPPFGLTGYRIEVQVGKVKFPVAPATSVRADSAETDHDRASSSEASRHDVTFRSGGGDRKAEIAGALRRGSNGVSRHGEGAAGEPTDSEHREGQPGEGQDGAGTGRAARVVEVSSPQGLA